MTVDLNLSDMTGFEVLNRMNGDGAVARCPVIVYTGRDLPPGENELMKYANSVIVKGAGHRGERLSVKPVDVDRLFSMLRVWLYQ